MSENHANKPLNRTRSGAILATVGVGVIMGLALFMVMWVAPFLETRAILEGYHTRGVYRVAYLDEREWFDIEMRRLGGPERALRRLASYSRLPRCIAPRRETAITILGLCGNAALPALERALNDEDRAVRQAAAEALKKIRGEDLAPDAAKEAPVPE